MPDIDDVKRERAQTALHRFFLYVGRLSEKYPYSVCDGSLTPKTIARFKERADAELFLGAKRVDYVQQSPEKQA